MSDIGNQFITFLGDLSLYYSRVSDFYVKGDQGRGECSVLGMGNEVEGREG